jgi:SAM-dependent methyltransferase
VSERSVPLNKVCELEDFADPEFASMIRYLEPEHVATQIHYPHGFEHRKSWEFVQLMRGAERLGAVTPESLVLSVAAGHERPIFALTHKARLVFATDIYGAGEFSDRESASSMLINPDAFTPLKYNRNRLVVQYMDALDLRHEEGTFDMVFCLSSLEHFGGFDGARRSLQEMHRVCKRGGIVMFTTECIVNHVPSPPLPDLELFSPRVLNMLVSSVRGLSFVEPMRFDISDATQRTVLNFEKLVADMRRNRRKYPHIVLELGGCHFTSVSVFLRKI